MRQTSPCRTPTRYFKSSGRADRYYTLLKGYMEVAVVKGNLILPRRNSTTGCSLVINFPGSTKEYNAENDGDEDLRNIQRILMTDEDVSANNQPPNTISESLINFPEGAEEYNAENDGGEDLRSIQRILMADEEASANNQPPNTNLVTRIFGESTN